MKPLKTRRPAPRLCRRCRRMYQWFRLWGVKASL